MQSAVAVFVDVRFISAPVTLLVIRFVVVMYTFEWYVADGYLQVLLPAHSRYPRVALQHESHLVALYYDCCLICL